MSLRSPLALVATVLALNLGLCLAAFPGGGSLATAGPPVSLRGILHIETSDYCADPEERALLGLINNYRADRGLGTVSLSQTLGAAAEHHSLDMAAHDYVGHTLSDGTSWTQNVIDHGYTPNTVLAENLASGSASALDTLDQWTNSETHRATLLLPQLQAVGIGRAFNASSSSGWYWTADFGGVADSAARLCDAQSTPTPTPAATLHAPTPSRPRDGSSTSDTTPSFSWGRSPGATAYTLELSSSPDFPRIDVLRITTSNRAFTPRTPLQRGATYYWRVRAQNDAGRSPWSNVRSFAVTD